MTTGEFLGTVDNNNNIDTGDNNVATEDNVQAEGEDTTNCVNKDAKKTKNIKISKGKMDRQPLHK